MSLEEDTWHHPVSTVVDDFSVLKGEGYRVEVAYSWQEAALATVRYLELKGYTSG